MIFPSTPEELKAREEWNKKESERLKSLVHRTLYQIGWRIASDSSRRERTWRHEDADPEWPSVCDKEVALSILDYI